MHIMKIHYNNFIIIVLIFILSSCLPPPDSFDNPELVVFELPVNSVFASGDDGNVPTNTLDNNLSTRWSSYGLGEWITYELNDTYEVQSINVSWYFGDSRIWYFDVLYSEDNNSWVKVYSGESSGTTNNSEKYDLQDAAAKYISIKGYGNSRPSDWNSITTVSIIGKKVDENTKFLDYDSIAPICGNNILEESEKCDNGSNNGMICNPPIGGNCTYCSNECKIIIVTDIQEEKKDYQIIELSNHATILDGPFNIIHDRRASNNLSVNAPWIYETLGESYSSMTPLNFTINGNTEEVSVWIRMYKDRTDSKGWRLNLPNGISRTVNTNILQEYVWVEAYRGIISDIVNASIQPLGPRSKLDTIIVTSLRESSTFDNLINLTKPGPVPNAKYYVAMNGSDTNSGSINSPFRTLQKAINLVQPGDTVLVREGIYAGFRIDKKSGSEDARITLQAYPGERVILDANITNQGYGVIEINNPSSYWTFDGFEIIDSNLQLDEVRKLDLRNSIDEQKYLEIRDQYKYLLGIRMWATTTREMSKKLIFRNMEIHNLFSLGFSGSTNGTLYENNHVYDTGYPQSGYAWYTSGPGVIHKNNIVHDSTRAVQVNSPGSYGSNQLYEKNLYYRNGRTKWYHVSSGTFKTAATVLVIITSDGNPPHNNIIRNNIFLYNGNGLEDRTRNGLVAHNSFIGNSGISSSNFALLLRGSNTRIINNLFYDNSKNIMNEGSGYTLSGNIESSLGVYENANKLDFRILSGASVIDSGTSLAEVNKDFFGSQRPQGAGWDVGAIERIS